MAKIKKGIEENGKIVLPCCYDDIKPAIIDDKESAEIYVTNDKSLFGFVDIKNNRNTKNLYNSISGFSNGLAIVSKWCISRGRKYGIITTGLYECLECNYDEIKRISDKFFLVRNDDKYGLYKAGIINRLFVPCECKHIEHYTDTVNSEITKEQLIIDLV